MLYRYFEYVHLCIKVHTCSTGVSLSTEALAAAQSLYCASSSGSWMPRMGVPLRNNRKFRDFINRLPPAKTAQGRAQGDGGARDLALQVLASSKPGSTRMRLVAC